MGHIIIYGFFTKCIRPNHKKKLVGVKLVRSHLKNRILAQGQGGTEFQTAGMLRYVEDLKPGTNTEIGKKDFFETASDKYDGF